MPEAVVVPGCLHNINLARLQLPIPKKCLNTQAYVPKKNSGNANAVTGVEGIKDTKAYKWPQHY